VLQKLVMSLANFRRCIANGATAAAVYCLPS